MTLFSIPPSAPFLDTLASQLFDQTRETPEDLSHYRILLPTRRACRALRDTFLRLSKGKPLLLPVMQPIGDIDADELDLQINGYGLAQALNQLPPVMPPLRRQLLLARTIQALPGYTDHPEQAIALAKALGQLMDQIYTENLSLSALSGLVPEDFAAHWQITLDFLKILSEAWPKILEEEGVIEAADYRNRLIQNLAALWSSQPPPYPVIAAGSTGSIPSTAKLLDTIARMPKGSVILPGLDQYMDDTSWHALDDTHPQATLKNLLAAMEVEREEVKEWPHTPSSLKVPSKVPLISEIMRPAKTTKIWKTFSQKPIDALDETLSNIHLLTCKSLKEEALAITLIMREALEEPEKTVALVTPDRNLARHVSATCERWGIRLDDSGGKTLNETSIGIWFRLTLDAMLHDPFSSSFLELLKHPFLSLWINSERFRNIIEFFESRVIRDPVYRRFIPDDPHEPLVEERVPGIGAFLDQIDAILKPHQKSLNRTQSFDTHLNLHIEMCEQLATDPSCDGADTLWTGDDGEAMSRFLSELREHAHTLGEMTLHTYNDILGQLLKTVTVRPKHGTHPRLSILGQLEARMVHADILILSGLNEGTWPPDPGADPWMSRPMRKDFGLPSPERSVGLSAHDFAQSFCAAKVYMTRSAQIGGAPTVPSRWLSRFDTVLQAHGKSLSLLENTNHGQWAQLIDKTGKAPIPCKRPAPTPPVEKRPKTLYVTDIERWMRDPYALYAKKILRLKKLASLDEEEGPAERGTLIHEILEAFIKAYPSRLPEDALDHILELGQKKLSEHIRSEKLQAFWWPRIARALTWFIEHEQQWRTRGFSPCAVEIQAEKPMDIKTPSGSFTLKARMDRLDLDEQGKAALIDYKTGTPPSKPLIQKGYAPQIPLTAMLIQKGAVEKHCSATEISYLGHWKISGGAVPGEEADMAGGRNKIDIDTLIQETEQGFIKLVEVFDSPATPYFSLPDPDYAPNAAYRDYDHLARYSEWENEGEAS